VKGRRALSDAWYRQQLPKEGLSRLHMVVFAAWGRGDATAALLLQRAAADYAASALAMAKASGATELYFGGGVISRAPEAFWGLLEKEVRQGLPEARVAAPGLGPDSGACLLAGFKAGLDVQTLWHSLEKVKA
jgi:N-acetylglucosamine kinase-like BadF-type ATPase